MAKMQEGNRGVRGKPEECIVFVLLIPRHVVFSYPPSPPNFSRLPTLQLEDMITFPC